MIIVAQFPLKEHIYYFSQCSYTVIPEKIVANLFALNCDSRNRVWKGNSRGIRDLTKLRCEIREKAKYIAGIRDLAALREAGFAKIWGRHAGFFALLLKFWKLSLTKLGKKFAGFGILEKGEWECGIRTPVSRPCKKNWKGTHFTVDAWLAD